MHRPPHVSGKKSRWTEINERRLCPWVNSVRNTTPCRVDTSSGEPPRAQSLHACGEWQGTPVARGSGEQTPVAAGPAVHGGRDGRGPGAGARQQTLRPRRTQ